MLILALAAPLLAQEFQVVQRGPNHSVLQRPGPPGEPPQEIVSLQTGMNYLENGVWKESEEVIEIVNNTAVARKGRHRVIFASNANTDGCIDIELPDGQRMRSHAIGLLYQDSATGASVPLAAIKNSEAALLPPNRIYYLDAFEGGGLTAHLYYSYTKAGLEQSVILARAPAPPEAYGLSAESTELCLVSEFLEAPEPVIEPVVKPDFIDHRIDFGSMAMGPGRAFFTGDAAGKFRGVEVAKEWSAGQKTYLTEAVRYSSIQPYLRTLPQAQAGIDQPQAKVQSLAEAFPAREAVSEVGSIQVAAAETIKEGLIIDYALQSSENSFRFSGSTTYLVVGQVVLSGTTIIRRRYSDSVY